MRAISREKNKSDSPTPKSGEITMMKELFTVEWNCQKCGAKSFSTHPKPGDFDQVLEIIRYDHSLFSKDCEFDGNQVMLKIVVDDSTREK